MFHSIEAFVDLSNIFYVIYSRVKSIWRHEWSFKQTLCCNVAKNLKGNQTQWEAQAIEI